VYVYYTLVVVFSLTHCCWFLFDASQCLDFFHYRSNCFQWFVFLQNRLADAGPGLSAVCVCVCVCVFVDDNSGRRRVFAVAAKALAGVTAVAATVRRSATGVAKLGAVVSCTTRASSW
jgi:hypothetical protein